MGRITMMYSSDGRGTSKRKKKSVVYEMQEGNISSLIEKLHIMELIAKKLCNRWGNIAFMTAHDHS